MALRNGHDVNDREIVALMEIRKVVTRFGFQALHEDADLIEKLMLFEEVLNPGNDS